MRRKQIPYGHFESTGKEQEFGIGNQARACFNPSKNIATDVPTQALAFCGEVRLREPALEPRTSDIGTNNVSLGPYVLRHLPLDTKESSVNDCVVYRATR
jgi:hypothetical protein